MKLKWQQAPVKTQWGDDMVVASVAIDNDHTLSLYCERDQAPKVEAMFALTNDEKHQLNDALNLHGRFPIIDAIESKIKEKNT